MGEDIDPFKLLNLPEEDVPQAAIEKAYKVMALKYHPDKNPDPSAQETFQRIQLAKEMLLDPDTKAALLRVTGAKWAREEQEQELEGQALENAQARKRFATELERREKQDSSARTELQRAQANLTSQMRKWHDERLAKKREELRKHAPTAAAATAAAAAAATPAGRAPRTATEATESATQDKSKPVDSETIRLLHKSLEVRWSLQHVQHDADSLRQVFEKFGDVVHVSMRGKRRTASSQRKAVVVMARSSAATTAAAQGGGPGTHILVTPLPKVANLETLPGASPEVLEAAAASLRRAGIQGGAIRPAKSSKVQGTAGASTSLPPVAPRHITSPSPHSTPDSLTVVLAAAAAAAARSGAALNTGEVAAGNSGAGGGSVTTGGGIVPTSLPPSFPRFQLSAAAAAGPSGTAATVLGGTDAHGSNPLPVLDALAAAVPSSFPVTQAQAQALPGSSVQASDTAFRAPESRAAPSVGAGTVGLATSAAPSSFPLPPDEGGSLQDGRNSINAEKLQPAAAVSAAPAAAASESAVQKQIERDQLRAQRLAELEAQGTDDEGT